MTSFSVMLAFGQELQGRVPVTWPPASSVARATSPIRAKPAAAVDKPDAIFGHGAAERPGRGGIGGIFPRAGSAIDADAAHGVGARNPPEPRSHAAVRWVLNGLDAWIWRSTMKWGSLRS